MQRWPWKEARQRQVIHRKATAEVALQGRLCGLSRHSQSEHFERKLRRGDVMEHGHRRILALFQQLLSSFAEQQFGELLRHAHQLVAPGDAMLPRNQILHVLIPEGHGMFPGHCCS